MTNEEKIIIDNIYKKFQTTMIGSLARFENTFGYLWENDSKQAEKFEEMWEFTRNSILNNGNKQARSAMDELVNYFNHRSNEIPQKYNYKFYFDKTNKNQGEKHED